MIPTSRGAASLARYEHLYIGGQWVAPQDGGQIESIDPSTGKPWALVAYGGKRDVDRAVAAAREAFNGPWRKMPGWERAALLRRLAEIYQRRAPELALLESRDSGRALREARADVGLSAVTLGGREPGALATLISRHDWHPWLVNGSDYPGPGVVAVMGMRALVKEGVLPAADAERLAHIQQHNPLLFDFYLKRCLSWKGERWPASVFEPGRVLRGGAL